MRRCASPAVRAARGRAGQLRGAAAAPAYPADGPAQGPRSVDNISPSDRAYFRLGPTNKAYHGNDYAFNAWDPEDPPLPDPVTGWRRDQLQGPQPTRGTSNGQYLSLAVPSTFALHEGDPKNLTSIQKAVVDLKRNPPIDFADPNDYERFTLGPGWFTAGASVGPLSVEKMKEQWGFTNSHLWHTNEPADGIADLPMGAGASSKDGVLTCKMVDSPQKCQTFQVPFSPAREAQGFKDMPLVKGAQAIDTRFPGRLEQEIMWHFGTVGVGYTIDGAATSNRDDEVRLRVFSDNSAHALFWTQLVQSLPGRDRFQQQMFRPPVVLYHAAGYTFESERVIEEYGGPKPKDFGLTHPKFVLVDPYCKPACAIIGGELSLDVARDVVSYLCAIVQFEELDVLTLPADGVLNADGSCTVYMGAGREKARSNPNLYGAHCLSLSPDGLGYMWDAVTKPCDDKSLQPGDLVVEQGGARTQTSPLLRRVGDATSRPKPRSIHWGSCGRTLSTRYGSVDGKAGLKLGSAPAAGPSPAAGVQIRPNLIPVKQVNVVFCDGAKTGTLTAEQAGKQFSAAVKEWGYPYALEDELSQAFAQAVEAGMKCSVGPPPA